MRLHNKKVLYKFFKKHQTAKKTVENWAFFVKDAIWSRPDDIKQEHPRTRFIDNNRSSCKSHKKASS